VKLADVLNKFSDEDWALEFVRSVRWPDGIPTCPRCNSTASWFFAKRRLWKCRNCSHKYGVRTNTLLEGSPIPLRKWLLAMWLYQNGTNSHQLHRIIGVCQLTAWRMLNRLAAASAA
jgi:transposase-like protein